MIKRLNNINNLMVDGNLVILERINNDTNGNPRFKAYIPNGTQTYVYTFTGHYCGDQGEAEHIYQHHLKVVGKA